MQDDDIDSTNFGLTVHPDDVWNFPEHALLASGSALNTQSSDSSNDEAEDDVPTVPLLTSLLQRNEPTSTAVESTTVSEYDLYDIFTYQVQEPTTHTSTAGGNEYEDKYEFTLLHPQEDNNKALKIPPWTYSAITGELYVKMNADCPLLFRLDRTPPAGTYIRVTPVYTRPEDMNYYPKRCLNHSDENHETNRGYPKPEHLVRSYLPGTGYAKDEATGRMSTILPYIPPDVGSNLSTYVVRFMCNTSCAGGVNRRPMALVFTLEHNGKYLGRQTRKVKVCACPGRDRQKEERLASTGTHGNNRNIVQDVKKACKRIGASLNSNTETESKQRKVYTVTVNSKLHYNILSALVPILQTNLGTQDDSSEDDG